MKIKWALIAGLFMAIFLAQLDQTVFATALPTIVGDLKGISIMSWVTTAYVLAVAIVTPMYGKFGDLLGRKHLLVGAIGLFLAGSVIGGLAHDMPILILGRAVQGLGGGGLITLAVAIIADSTDSVAQRSNYNAMIGGAYALAAVSGPVIGGVLTQALGWRSVFWANIFLGLVALFLAAKFLHPTQQPRKKVQVDYRGITLLTIMSTVVILIATYGGTSLGWLSPTTLLMAAIAVISFVLFIRSERRASEPLIPLEMFHEADFRIIVFASLSFGIVLIGTIAYVPTYLQMVTGRSIAESGLLMIPMMLGTFAVSRVVSVVIKRRETWYKGLLIIGMSAVAVALVGMSTMTPATPLWLITWVYLLTLGAGLGMCVQLMMLVAQSRVSRSRIGTATSTYNYVRQIGGALGAAFIGTLIAQDLKQSLAGHYSNLIAGGSASLTPAAVRALPDHARLAVVNAYSDALTHAFPWVVPFVIAGIVALVLLSGRPLHERLPEPAPSDEAL